MLMYAFFSWQPRPTKNAPNLFLNISTFAVQETFNILVYHIEIFVKPIAFRLFSTIYRQFQSFEGLFRGQFCR